MIKSILDIKPSRNERIYALGDVHGCYDELVALEKRIQVSIARSNSSKFRIISVGDLCDRGPDASKVMEHFVQGKAAGTHELILGNHEIYFMLAFSGMRPDLIEKSGVKYLWFHRMLMVLFPQMMTKMESWRANGGDYVFRSYGADFNNAKTWNLIPPAHLRLLFESPLIVRTPQAVLSHALIHSGDLEILEAYDLASQNSVSGHLTDHRTDNFTEALSQAVFRCLWERKPSPARIEPTRRHISGHTPTKTVVRDLKQGTIQIDTGAVYGRKLSAIDVRSFRVISVPSHYNYKKQ
jgi:Calcineurin-like phosphoesterase